MKLLSCIYIWWAPIGIPSYVAAHRETQISHRINAAVAPRQKSKWDRFPTFDIHLWIRLAIERRKMLPKQRQLSLVISECKNKWANVSSEEPQQQRHLEVNWTPLAKIRSSIGIACLINFHKKATIFGGRKSCQTLFHHYHHYYNDYYMFYVHFLIWFFFFFPFIS